MQKKQAKFRFNEFSRINLQNFLNQVKFLLNILPLDVLKGIVWHSGDLLASQVINYTDIYNKEQAKPFELI